MASSELPPEVAERLGPFYVYALVDPRDGEIFYVGKGTGKRLLAHGLEADILSGGRGNQAKLARIREIRASGIEPRLDVIRHSLSESEALLVEAALIDTLRGLTNAVSGHGSAAGRMPLSELVVTYGAEPIPAAAPPAMLVRLGAWREAHEEVEPGYFRRATGFSVGMSSQELLDATRCWWRVSPDSVQRRGIEHAVAVHEGVTRAVMTIRTWISRDDGRRAFAGRMVGSGPVFDAWVGPFGRRVPFAPNSQNPITYWPSHEK